MRLKTLLAAPVIVLLLAAALVAARSSSPPTTLTTAPAVASGPITPSSPSEGVVIANAVTAAKAEADARWYAEAGRQYDEQVQRDAEKAAAVAIQGPRVSGTASAAASSPEPTPPPTPTGGGSAEDAVRFYFGDIFDQAWGAADGTPYGVTNCESTHDPNAVSSGGGNWGLFQINTVHHDSFEAVTGHSWSEVLDPYLNAQFARWLYDQSGGWGPWSCRWAAR